ncbi:MAG: hypothetical protein RMA76_41605 [Deltaproteobacteria bacterium]|jgi:hypothetical protein
MLRGVVSEPPPPRPPLWTLPLRVVTDHYRTDRLVEMLATVQSLRAAVEDVQGAVLHFAALPTRQDVRKLRRRVGGLRRRVAELDLALARLERARAPHADEVSRAPRG